MEIEDETYVPDRDAGDPPQVTVTWIDDTYTDLLMRRSDVEHEWTGVIPVGTVPKVVAGLVVQGLAEHETLCLPDLRLLRLDLLTEGMGKRPWWWLWKVMRRRI